MGCTLYQHAARRIHLGCGAADRDDNGAGALITSMGIMSGSLSDINALDGDELIIVVRHILGSSRCRVLARGIQSYTAASASASSSLSSSGSTSALASRRHTSSAIRTTTSVVERFDAVRRRSFFHDTVSGRTAWTRGELECAHARAELEGGAGAKEDDSLKWQRAEDTTTGRSYYWHVQTHERRWHKPEDTTTKRRSEPSHHPHGADTGLPASHGNELFDEDQESCHDKDPQENEIDDEDENESKREEDNEEDDQVLPPAEEISSHSGEIHGTKRTSIFGGAAAWASDEEGLSLLQALIFLNQQADSGILAATEIKCSKNCNRCRHYLEQYYRWQHRATDMLLQRIAALQTVSIRQSW